MRTFIMNEFFQLHGIRFRPNQAAIDATVNGLVDFHAVQKGLAPPSEMSGIEIESRCGPGFGAVANIAGDNLF